ncbi:unnamed protein product [Citrullus colocynthis]|uniref:Leucine-rich repeat-containing N-terminal plant-type domain-containing protein n=1 Tax=Citrullus colocynthis TaxID=252529 RepID=A0ABP0Z5N9_9ROSI
MTEQIWTTAEVDDRQHEVFEWRLKSGALFEEGWLGMKLNLYHGVWKQPPFMKCCKFELFVMSFLLLNLPLSSAALRGNDTDKLALLSFKSEITVDPFGLFISWNKSVHFCNWKGVKCSPQQRLWGEIPQEIGSLSKLQVLDLDNNYFVGEIPITISNCSELQYIGFFRKNLTGLLPKEFGLLAKLEELQLTSNKLFGEIPLKNLTVLSIGANNLTGTIPSLIYNLSSIRIFSLPVNQLEGSLPTYLGLIFPDLQILRIHTNQFSGSIPFTLSNASKLVVFAISRNMFTGKVPSLTNMRDLEELELFENNLGFRDDHDKNFLASLVNCTNLTTLVISDNNFGGVLPEYISNFSTKLGIIGFGRNYIHGTIPTEIGNLVGLTSLGLESNQLTGFIPSSLGKLRKLGTIPHSFGNLSALGSCNRRLNNLTGPIPSSLAEIQNLLMLALSQNHLTGTIPKELLSYHLYQLL